MKKISAQNLTRIKTAVGIVAGAGLLTGVVLLILAKVKKSKTIAAKEHVNEE